MPYPYHDRPLPTPSTIGMLCATPVLSICLLCSSCVPSELPRTACAIVDLASEACGAFVSVKMPDGTVVRVPKGDLKVAAERSLALGTNEKIDPPKSEK